MHRDFSPVQNMVVPSAAQHILLPQGGALGRGRSDYPLPWRQASWLIHPYGLYEDLHTFPGYPCHCITFPITRRR